MSNIIDAVAPLNRVLQFLTFYIYIFFAVHVISNTFSVCEWLNVINLHGARNDMANSLVTVWLLKHDKNWLNCCHASWKDNKRSLLFHAIELYIYTIKRLWTWSIVRSRRHSVCFPISYFTFIPLAHCAACRRFTTYIYVIAKYQLFVDDLRCDFIAVHFYSWIRNCFGEWHCYNWCFNKSTDETGSNW